ncbi:hypothetical protein CRYUN_Cryun06bG0024500 [Craigia yunnanensis]
MSLTFLNSTRHKWLSFFASRSSPFFCYCLSSPRAPVQGCLFLQSPALSSGACGYGSLALGLSGGHLADGVSSFYKDGSGCGACFQIRCKNSTLCSSKGTRMTITDLNHNNQTDFVLTSRASWPWLTRVGSSNWNFMSRNYGAVWDTIRVPNGALQFRFVMTSGFDGKWI